MAPGLRCLGARRRHARTAGDEHRGVSRRGDADQRPADVHPREPQIGRAARRARQATTSYPLWTLDQATISRLVAAAGIVAPTGKPGAVLMFHGNLVHASTANITPYPRTIVYLTLCAVSNHIRRPTRPEWIAHRDFTPIAPARTTHCGTRARIALPRNTGRFEWRSPPSNRRREPSTAAIA